MDQTYKNRTSGLIESVQRFSAQALYDAVDRFQPDKIIATHFLIPQLFEGRLTCPLEMVITDFGFHHIWYHPLIRHYYVAQPTVAQELIQLGINHEMISITGIPIDASFMESVDKPKVREALGLRNDRPTLLVLSGGFGFGRLEKTVERLLMFEIPLQIIAGAGKNKLLLERLSQLRVPSHHKLVNLGFVSTMHELLSISDIVISKAGGLTISECLTKGVGLVMFGAVPGQEEENIKYVLSEEAGVSVRDLDELGLIVRDFLIFPEALDILRRRARIISKPQAASSIVESLLDLSRIAA